MPISKEQSQEIKTQILAQVENSNVENKEQIKKSIKEMNEEELEQFLKQNNIPISGMEGETPQQKPPQQQTGECIFCSITNKNIPSYILEETKKAMAILEINPLAKGHSIVIPIEHTPIEKLPKSAMTLAQKIAKRMKKKLQPEDIKIESSNFQGHTMINIIPLYQGQKLEKRKADEKELKALQKKLELKKRTPRKTTTKKPTIKLDKENLSKLQEIHFRIP